MKYYANKALNELNKKITASTGLVLTLTYNEIKYITKVIKLKSN